MPENTATIYGQRLAETGPVTLMCNCGATFPEGGAREVDGEASCGTCAENAYVCTCCESLSSDNHGDADTVLCETCRERSYCICEDCARVTNVDNTLYTESQGVICIGCYEDIYFTCQGCDCVLNNDCYGADGYCDSCYSDQGGDGDVCERRCSEPRIGQTFTRMGGAQRKFGIELEFVGHDYGAASDICDRLGWGACYDGSVDQEFKSPPMSGDQALESIEQFCRMIAASDFKVSDACGFHLHLDMKNESDRSLGRLAVAYMVFLPLWRAFVPNSRARNHYCNGDERAYGSAKKIAATSDKPHKNNQNRYCAVNWQAYQNHGTVEIRLHTGTANPKKVVNWVRAHLAFIEWARKQSIKNLLMNDGLRVSELFARMVSGAWANCPDVAEFYARRASRFGSPVVLPTVTTVAVDTFTIS